jgi:hypothetical protein
VDKLHIAKDGDARTIVFLFQLFQAPLMSGVASPLRNNLREKMPMVRFTGPFIGYPNDPDWRRVEHLMTSASKRRQERNGAYIELPVEILKERVRTQLSDVRTFVLQVDHKQFCFPTTLLRYCI